MILLCEVRESRRWQAPGAVKKDKNTKKSKKNQKKSCQCTICFCRLRAKSRILGEDSTMFPSTKFYEIFIVALFMIYYKAVKISNKFNESFLSYG